MTEISWLSKSQINVVGATLGPPGTAITQPSPHTSVFISYGL